MKINNAVIILNYNSTRETINCLKELSKVERLMVVVIDNNSPDNPKDQITKLFPRIIFIRNTCNLGFSGGNNIGINYLLGLGIEKIMLLNSDTQFTIWDIRKLFNTEGDIVGPVLVYKKNNKQIYDLGGYINELIGRATHEEVNSPKNIGPRDPDYISGAVILVRREVFQKIGLLNERYFLYYEDSDFCFRARKAGYSVRINTDIRIFHELSHSVGKKSFVGLYHNLRSNLIFILNNIHWYFKPLALTYWILLSFKVFTKYSLSMIKSN